MTPLMVGKEGCCLAVVSTRLMTIKCLVFPVLAAFPPNHMKNFASRNSGLAASLRWQSCTCRSPFVYPF